MARNNPCLLCKQRRRKCERAKGAKSCKRCADRNIQCVLYSSTYKTYGLTDDPDDIPTSTVVTLYEELRDLEQQIQHLDLELQQQRALQTKEPTWTINVVNGRFQLATKIKTLEEFLLYGKSAIKYLSPFGNTFHTTSLEFSQPHPSVLKMALQAVSKFYKQDAAIPQFSVVLSHRIIKQPRDIYKQLVENYFNCFNDAIPILHEPSYWEHLNSLTDPLSDAVTLAICAASSILTCEHSIRNATEKRYFGEYFYERAREILVDIFDDPEKAFESILVISLLQMFLIKTLRFEESKKWGEIAIILCRNLHQEVGDFTNGGPHLPKSTRIKYALLHRNYAVSQCYTETVAFIINNKADGCEFLNHKEFDILPDESPKIKQLIELINEIRLLSLHPASILVYSQSKQMTMGEQAQLSVEQFIRYEETIIEWWHKLPEKFKICSEPLNLSSYTIDRTTEIMKLLMACYFHTFNLNIQALLVQAKPKDDSDNLNHMLRERAMHFAMYSADMLLKLAKRMGSINSYCFSPYKLFIHSIDALMSVINIHFDGTFNTKVDSKINEYMFELRRTILPDNQVVSSASPLAILSAVPPGQTPSLNELYKNYPLPGEALMFDIIQTTVERTRNFA